MLGMAAIGSAQSTPPLRTIMLSSDGGNTFQPDTSSSSVFLGDPNATPPGFVPMCSSNGLPPFSQCSFGGGGGSGTVTSVSGLTPLFSVTNPTTTPTFALSNAAGNTLFGNCTGSTAAPSYCALTVAMLPTGIPNSNLATPFNALSGDATSTSTGGATTVKGINGTLLSGLATGPLYNTTTTGVPSIGTPTPSSSIFYIASSCNGLTNCLAWVDDDSTDNCGSATTAFMTAINSYAGPGEAHVYIEGSGSGKAYKLASCNLAFTGPSGTGGTAGSASIQSFATIDCAQTGGNCIQGGKTGCPTGSAFYSTGCHDFTWRGGTFVGGVGLGTAIFEIEPGMNVDIIDDVTFNNTGAGNATLGTCTNYTVQWDTWIATSEFSRNKFQGNVAGQCFSKNVDITGGANTIVFTNNSIQHTSPALGGTCGGVLHTDSSMHSTIDNNALFGFAVVLDLYQSSSATIEGGWMITGNNVDTGTCTVPGGVSASVQFGLASNNAAVGPVTLANNNGYTSPLIAQNHGSTAAMQGWSITGNNTTQGSSFLIGGSNTACSAFNGLPCYLGANPGYPTTASGGAAYVGFTVLGAATGSTTWPPTAAIPTFSPAAGAVTSGTTVTTSCTGGSPYISTGSTAVAGATGIAVSTAETLYGSCQGSGYFSTGSALYTISGVTTYLLTTFNEASSGSLLAGTTPATCSGCTTAWVNTSNNWTYGTNLATTSTPGSSGVTIAQITTGHANATFRATISSCITPFGCELFVRRTDTNNYAYIYMSSAGTQLFDVVAGVQTQIGSTITGTTFAGNYTVVMSGTAISLTTPNGTTSGTTANTGTGIGMNLFTGSGTPYVVTTVSLASS